MALTPPEPNAVTPTFSDDAPLARAQLYLHLSGVGGDELAAMSRQLQAVTDPDAPADQRTRRMIERAILLGRPRLDDAPLPQVIPPVRNRREVHRQELGKPVAALRPGWWWAPWRKLWRQWRRGRDD